MTVTKDTSLLCSFKSKIDEAICYVPRMPATEKVKAVKFWNQVSEKLQDIVNKNAADINAAAVKTAENELEKMHLDINNSGSVNVPNCNISADFMNLPSNYGISCELMEQYHSVDIGNTQLLASEAFSLVTESSLNSISNISQLSTLNNSMNSCERSIAENYITVESLPENSCDTLVLNSCLSGAPRTIETVLEEPAKSNIYHLKGIDQETSQVEKSPENDTKVIPGDTCDQNNVPLISQNVLLTKDNKKSIIEDGKKVSILKLSLLKNENSKCVLGHDGQSNVSGDSESSKDSVKSEFKTVISAEESDSNRAERAEPIVSFVVSCSEEILAKNGVTPEVNEKCSDNCAGHKCLHFKPYTCSDCPAKFTTKGNLIVHKRKHTGEKPYPCLKCLSSFTTKGNLLRHLRTHTGEKPFQCTQCGSKFTENKSLKVHMRCHTGEKPYECKECGKRFAQSGILRTHMAMHLNQKIHLCEHCGKSFRQRSQLHIHMLRHANIRKHGCSSCSSRFLTKGDLDRHMRVHTGERPYTCEICARKFTRQQSLNEHMNRHYGRRPYVCKYCNKAFTEMSACYKHIKLHEKASADGSENSQTESSSEPPKLPEESSHSISYNSSMEVIRLSKTNTLKPQYSEHSSKVGETMETNQNIIATFIDNFVA